MKLAMIIPMIAIIGISLANAILINEISYSVKIDFEDNSIFINNVKLVEGAASKTYNYDSYEYKLKLISFKNEIIDSKQFNLPLYAEDIDEKITKGSRVVSLPYHSEGQMIILTKAGREIAQIDVKYLATCNQDGFCESLETKSDCPEDCEITETEILEKAAQEKPEKEVKPAANRLAFIIAIFLLLIMALIYFARRNKK